jgi:hypothetical protein
MRTIFILFFLLASSLIAEVNPVLPPVQTWNGKSRSLVAAASDAWVTPSEKSGLRTTPSYDETVAWLRRLVDAAPELEMISLGKSHEGRDVWMVIASKEKAFTPEAMRAGGKAIVLAQGGIHAGEIDGKDAGLMLLRDMTVRGTRRELLDRANFLFVPILNVDGHERSSRFARINQRGPEIQGWRTNARNLNLNRDYTKLETPEVQAIVRAIDSWDPDIYLDLHVTDGADYQYDITFGHSGRDVHSTSIARWLDDNYMPAVTRALADMGHSPGPLGVATYEPKTPEVGLYDWAPAPRLSNGYGDARYLPTILVENHSLKPYDRRVLGTYVVLDATLRLLGEQTASLRKAIGDDRARRSAVVPLEYETAKESRPIDFLGIESKLELSPVSGDVKPHYTGKPVTIRMPYRDRMTVAKSATRPVAYWIPPAWSDVAAKLVAHGITVERLSAPMTISGEMYRLTAPKRDDKWYEGAVRVTATPIAERRSQQFPAGSFRVSTDQPLGDLAMILLEPSCPDSFFQWGWFNSVLYPIEYIEAYVMEPTAEAMLAADPKLREEFQHKLISDEAFRKDPDARLKWFYEKTPFDDERAFLYPVLREIAPGSETAATPAEKKKPAERKIWKP